MVSLSLTGISAHVLAALTQGFFHLLTGLHRTFSSSHLHFSQYSSYITVSQQDFPLSRHSCYMPRQQTPFPKWYATCIPEDQKDSLINLSWHPCLGGIESKCIFSGQRLSLSPHRNNFGFRSCYKILPASEKLTEQPCTKGGCYLSTSCKEESGRHSPNKGSIMITFVISGSYRLAITFSIKPGTSSFFTMIH